MKKSLFLTVIIIAFAYTAYGNTHATIVPDATYMYARKGSCELYMDIYEPDITSEKIYNGKEKPTIIFVFGGGFKRGSKSEPIQQEWYKLLNENGFRVIAIDYRLGLKGVKNISPYKTKPFEKSIYIAVHDLFSATKYIIDHSFELGIDPDNIIISGSSAGAITVLQAEYELSNRTRHSSEIPEGFRYKGVISFAGAVFARGGKPKYAKAPTATLFLHGTEDKIVTYKKISAGNKGMYGPDKLVEIYDKYGINYSIFRYKGRGHEIANSMIETIDQQLYFIYTNIMDEEKKIIDAVIADPNITDSFSYKNLRDLYK